MKPRAADHPYREFEHTGWQRAAGQYAGTFEAATRLFAPFLLDAAEVRGKIALLDVACGAGVVTEMAAARGAAAVGVDFSHNMIAEATRRWPALDFVEADAESLPFGDSTFDAVVINFGVQHFSFPVSPLAEAHRVLRTGGRLAFTVWGPPEESALQSIPLQAVREAGNPAATLPAPPHGGVNQVATCTRLLLESGFGPLAPRVEKVGAALRLESVPDLVHMLQNGTVRLAALLSSQPRERTAAILAGIEKAAARYQDNGQLRIPVTAILAVGVKAAAIG